MNTREEEVIKIDVDAVLRGRVPGLYRFMPRALVAWLERLVCQDRLNGLLENNRGARGADFCAGVLRDLNVSYHVDNPELLPDTDHRRAVYVCNHPLGALDGICIIDLLARHYGPRLHFVVNDLLMAIHPLREVFLPINKHGAQSRESSERLDAAFAGNDPVIVFPAGLVSRRGKDGIVADKRWHKMFVNKCIANHRDVVPLFFNARNSKFFYNFAKWRSALGLKFNLEMLLLPSEVFKCENSNFNIRVGERVAWSSLRGGSRAQQEADAIKTRVYNLSMTEPARKAQ